MGTKWQGTERRSLDRDAYWLQWRADFEAYLEDWDTGQRVKEGSNSGKVSDRAAAR